MHKEIRHIKSHILLLHLRRTSKIYGLCFHEHNKLTLSFSFYASRQWTSVPWMKPGRSTIIWIMHVKNRYCRLENHVCLFICDIFPITCLSQSASGWVIQRESSERYHYTDTLFMSLKNNNFRDGCWLKCRRLQWRRLNSLSMFRLFYPVVPDSASEDIFIECRTCDFGILCRLIMLC